MRKFFTEMSSRMTHRKRPELPGPEYFQPFFQSRNEELHQYEIAHAVRAVMQSPGKTLFDVAGIENNTDNSLRLMGNVLRVHISDSMPSALDAGEQPAYWQMHGYTGLRLRAAESDILTLMRGNSPEIADEVDVNVFSLSRHLDRSATLARIFIEECLDHRQIPYGFSTLHDSDPRLREFADQELGGLHPFHLPVVLHFHDLPRHITHSSAHDSLVPRLALEVGLTSPILQSFHDPVPTDVDLPENYDPSGAQMLSRLADNFGKVEFIEGYGYRLRRSIDAMCAYSRERQIYYFTSEHDNPDSLWYGKDMNDVERYLANERKAYEHAVRWFGEQTGQPFESFMAHVDNHAQEFEIFFR